MARLTNTSASGVLFWTGVFNIGLTKFLRESYVLSDVMFLSLLGNKYAPKTKIINPDVWGLRKSKKLRRQHRRVVTEETQPIPVKSARKSYCNASMRAGRVTVCQKRPELRELPSASTGELLML
jgi:hypothetical protein